MADYVFPLRHDLNVGFRNLPRDMKVAEANRIAAFLAALATEDPCAPCPERGVDELNAKEAKA